MNFSYREFLRFMFLYLRQSCFTSSNAQLKIEESFQVMNSLRKVGAFSTFRV